MLTDKETNFLYLADCLPKKQPKFFNRFLKALYDHDIRFDFLPNTKDIWAVDYMPIQTSKERFVQFTYNPDYLKLKEDQKTISDVDSISKAIRVKTKKSKLIVDGGNISRTADKVIMCDKVFYENRTIPEKKVIKQLKELFEVDKLFFVPWDIEDFTGHADGMVRFINSDTVLINDYSKYNREFQISLRMSLHNAGLEWVELPYNPPTDPKSISAKGLYLNYLQMEQAVIMPTFNIKNDEKAFKILEKAFRGQTFATVDSNEIAREGGVLNCITWNIYSEDGKFNYEEYRDKHDIVGQDLIDYLNEPLDKRAIEFEKELASRLAKKKETY